GQTAKDRRSVAVWGAGWGSQYLESRHKAGNVVAADVLYGAGADGVRHVRPDARIFPLGRPDWLARRLRVRRRLGKPQCAEHRPFFRAELAKYGRKRYLHAGKVLGSGCFW